MNPRTGATIKQIEDAAQDAHLHVRQAVGHATAGDFHRAHGEAEQAQGAARRLKELLGAASTAGLRPRHPTPR